MQFTACVFFLICLIWPFWAMGCDNGGRLPRAMAIGHCEYAEINGRAIITAVKAAAADAYNCKDAVEVVFSFVPDDPWAKDNYRFAHHSDTGLRFTLGAGLNPPRRWAQRVGLTQGTTHRCVRQELIKGACTPVVFIFPDLDLAGWEKGCF